MNKHRLIYLVLVMKILALETSCDETSAAVVESGRLVLSNIILSQASTHQAFGGVVPEVASRQHLENIHQVIDQALEQAECKLESIDQFAATLGPGLVGSLLIGANAAKTLHLITQKPFVGVHHLQAHVASNYLESSLEPPFLCLLVSGGHTQLIHVKTYQNLALLGETRDDAIGEAYDKVARLLGLDYPGGPHVDNLAQSGDPKAFQFPLAYLPQSFDFSYSGLKTAVLRLVQSQAKPTPQFLADCAASFQYAAVSMLVKKTQHAMTETQLKHLAICGGVAANSEIRQRFATWIDEQGSNYHLFLPKLEYCTDNAAMVGSAAYYSPYTRDLSVEVFSKKSTHAVAGIS